MEQVFVLFFIYVLLYNNVICYQGFNYKPIISVELSPIGFHRDLTYVIHFDYPIAGKECEYLIEQKLPSAVYINVDQLNDMVRQKKLVALYPFYIDIEVPTEKSLPFSVLLLGNPKISDSIILPIHFRYHMPRKTNFVNVEIKTPHLYFKCLDKNDTIDYIPQTNQTFCIENTNFVPEDKIFFTEYTVEILDHICGWQLLDYDLLVKSSLVANIPVGDSNLFKFVFYITIMASWVGCFSILGTVYKKMQKLENKIK